MTPEIGFRMVLIAGLLLPVLACGNNNEPAQSEQPLPAGSGSTGRIVFVSDRDGNNEIYVVDSDGSGLTNLTNSRENDGDIDGQAEDEYGLTWSPDGTRIVFETSRDGFMPLYVMDADGASQTRLIKDTQIGLSRESVPKWSPDGQLIAFISVVSPGDDQLCFARPNDSEFGCLASATTHPSSVAWSPDSKRVAFLDLGRADSARVDDVYLIDPDGTDKSSVADNASYDSLLDWSPDAEHIVYNSYWGLNADIYVASSDGSDPTRLTDDGATDLHPAWSPDGKRIAFASDRDGSFDIYAMDADGSNLNRLTNHRDHELMPAWSPGGGQIAFVSASPATDGEETYEFSIVVSNADGSNRKVVADSMAGLAVPQWAPLPW